MSRVIRQVPYVRRMSASSRNVIERHCDVAVIGGSAAGLAAALQIARQRRSVIVIDSGEPRNAPAAHMHGYLGHEGLAPAEFLGIAREEIRSYGGEVLAGRAVEVAQGDEGRFHVSLTGGHRVTARRVIAATGLVDELPDIDGVAEQWGRGVIHCPFCHGFEVRDQRIAHIVTHPMGLHAATLFSHLSARYTLVLDSVDPANAELAVLRASGVPILEAGAKRVVTGDDGLVSALELADGRHLDTDVVVIGAPFRARIEPFIPLGIQVAAHVSGLGTIVETDAMGETAIPGLYACGNMINPGQQVLHAAANGSMVGAMAASSLAAEDLRDQAQSSGNALDWDHRYSGEQLWSGNPNGSLVNEISGMAPGRALDIGAGEGGDAVWLAEQGWAVTANDISQRGLDRVAGEAQRRRLNLRCLAADANALDPFEQASYDLVCAHYASIPRTPDNRAIQNARAAVAPGGTLLVVGHDLEPMRTAIDVDAHSRAFDADAFVRIDDFAAVIAACEDWTIETHETRPRPSGASTHHVDDVVLRCRRNR